MKRDMLLNYRHFTEDQISTIKFKVKHLSGRQKTKRQKANVVNRGGGWELSRLLFARDMRDSHGRSYVIVVKISLSVRSALGTQRCTTNLTFLGIFASLNRLIIGDVHNKCKKQWISQFSQRQKHLGTLESKVTTNVDGYGKLKTFPNLTLT